MDSNVISNVFWGIVGSLLGVLLVIGVQQLIDYLKTRKGFLTGRWEQWIYDPTGTIVIRKDNVVLEHYQRNHVIKARINRFQPLSQNFKSWGVFGRIEGHMLFCTFWSTDLKKNPGSYGTIQLHMINQSKFTGFYVKLDIDSTTSGYSERLIQTKLKWIRP